MSTLRNPAPYTSLPTAQCILHPPSHLHDVDGPVTVHVVHPEGPLELLLRRALRGDQSEWAPWSRDLVSTNHSSPPRWRAAPAGTPRSRWCRCCRCRRCGRRGHCGTGQRELMMTINLNLENTRYLSFIYLSSRIKIDGLRHPDPCSWTAPRCPWGRPAGTWTRTSPWWAGRWDTRLGTRSTSPGREIRSARL